MRRTKHGTHRGEGGWLLTFRSVYKGDHLSFDSEHTLCGKPITDIWEQIPTREYLCNKCSRSEDLLIEQRISVENWRKETETHSEGRGASMNIDQALARIEGMVQEAQRGGVQELRPEEVAQNRAADAAQDALDGPTLALLVVQLGRALEKRWCQATAEWYGSRQHFDCRRPDCDRCTAIAALLAFAETLGEEGGEG